MTPCSVYAPDGNLTCTLDAGHEGWHQADGSQWFGAQWNCDHWADTQAAPTQSTATATAATPAPTQYATVHTVNTEQRSWGTTIAWASAITITAIFIVGGITATSGPHRTQPEARTDCAMRWVDAHPTHPLCDDSPDRNSNEDLVAKYCVGVNERHVCNNKDNGVPPVIIGWPPKTT